MKANADNYRPFGSGKIPILLFAAFFSGIIVYSFTLLKAYDIQEKYITENISQFGQLPPSAVQTTSLEFTGVVSDYLFFKTMTFLGMKIGEKKNPTLEEWQTIHQMLQQISDLDPKFWDPYMFSEMMLAWHAGMVDEANQLLEKATIHLPNNYRPSYYIGFNYLFFKKDSASAAPYLRKAAQYAEAPEFIKALASRVSLYAGQTGTGIVFLETVLKESGDPRMAGYLEKRLTALKMMFFLEQKVEEYREKTGSSPESLNDLIVEEIVSELPDDPYGGEFILLENGRIYTTSEMRDMK